MKLFNLFRKKKDEEIPSNSPQLLAVKLFFKEEPFLVDTALHESLRKRFENFKCPQVKVEQSHNRQFFFEDYVVSFEEGDIPAQAGLFVPDSVGIQFQELESAFRQSWNWQDAEKVTRACNYEILLTDIMSRNLDYRLRLEYFQKFVASIVEAIRPDAIWISNSQKIMNAEDYLESFKFNDYQNLNSFMNVRLFNMESSKDEMIMDTLGLHSLSLPDFEWKFSNYDPSVVAGLLFNYGNYIFESGVVIENGDTIQGLEEQQKLKCHFSGAILEPERVVYSLDAAQFN